MIVEDHIALRRGMELLLTQDGCEVVGATNDAAQAYELIQTVKPDVVVMDIQLPGESGPDLTKRLLEADSSIGVLLYTGVEDPEILTEALDCGARGFAFKAGAPEELKAAIRAVAAGEGYIDPRLGSVILGRSTTERIGVLSPREREVLDLLARGLTGEQAARNLSLSPETVRTHVRNAMKKLEANTRSHAIAIALRQHEIES